MSSFRRVHNDENPSTDDERRNNKEMKTKVRLLEKYVVTNNSQLEELIDGQDYRSIIDLSYQHLTDQHMATIIKHGILKQKCRILNLWRNQLTSDSLFLLANALNGNRTLRELDLSYNHLFDEGARILSTILSSNTCAISEIDLSSTGITDKGVKYLADMLIKNQTLKRLSLNRNEITNDGLVMLVRTLIHDNQKLKQLKVENNPFITQTGVEYILDLLKNNQRLKSIYVKDCSINNEVKAQLQATALDHEIYLIV